MGISALAVCCRRALNASLGSGRRGGELGRPIAIGRTGVAQRRLIDEAVVQDGATASTVIAGREPAKQKCSTGMSPRTDSGHDVSILITAVDAAGLVRGEEPRWNGSMMIMRPPQHGHGGESGFGAVAPPPVGSPAPGCAPRPEPKTPARGRRSAR